MSEDKRDAFGRIQEEPTVIVGGFNNEPGLTPPADDVREALAQVLYGNEHGRTSFAHKHTWHQETADAILSRFDVRPRGAPADDVREAVMTALRQGERTSRKNGGSAETLFTSQADAVLAAPSIDVRPRGTVTDAADIISALSDFGRFGPLGYREQKIAEAAIALARA